MALGRRQPPAGPEEDPVPWETVSSFVISKQVRTGDAPRQKPMTGRQAIRVPGGLLGSCLAPAAYVLRPDRSVRAWELRSAMDENRLVCRVAPLTSFEAGGAQGADRGDLGGFRVLDADGAEVGRVLQTGKAKRSIQHALWLQQPDHPNVVARYHWAVGSSGDVADRAGTAVFNTAADAAFELALSVITLGLGDGDGESSDSGETKPTTWRAGSEVVLTHGDAVSHRARYTRQAGWLDMRLAFALAAIRGR